MEKYALLLHFIIFSFDLRNFFGISNVSSSFIFFNRLSAFYLHRSLPYSNLSLHFEIWIFKIFNFSTPLFDNNISINNEWIKSLIYSLSLKF